jgi:two-component system sensor histidine kinase/response regulator
MTIISGLILLIQGYFIIFMLLAVAVLLALLIREAYQYGLKKAFGSNSHGVPHNSQQLNSLISSLNDIIFEFNEDKICLNVWFNEQKERVVDPKQCIGKKLEDILGYERAFKFNEALNYVIQNRKPTAIEYLSDHGTGNWLRASMTPVFDREGNYTARISASVADISEQKKYADALKENEALLIEAQAVAKIGNWCYDYSNKQSYWSKSLFNILEIDAMPEGISEFDYYINLVHPDDRDAYGQYLLTLGITEQKQYEHRLITPNGNLKYIKVIKGDPIIDEEGNPKRIFGIIQDVTDQQKATQELITAKEIAEEASRFKSDFLSIMSHEIRTPMNAVIGTTNLLLSDDPKPGQLEYLNILKFSADNLMAIINDILDYNKIEAGKLKLNKLKFNIHHLAEKIRQSFLSKALEKGLKIELVVDAAIPEFINGDQIRLSQMLNNLISNAVKFTHQGKILIQLQAERTGSKQANIKFTVTDTGIGIAPENLELIFDPFIQEPMANNSSNGGTGLGLAITKRLINLHGSDISVTSEQGKGSEFTFTIAFDLPKKTHSQPDEPGKEAMLNLHGMNVLVVDDNKMNLLIVSRFLKRWQAVVDEALNGAIAVKMVKSKAYDLIIMDLQMPVMDGFEATELIRKINRNIPIIALTADAMPETYNKAVATGISSFLTKPFIPAVFFEKVSGYYKQPPVNNLKKDDEEYLSAPTEQN